MYFPVGFLSVVFYTVLCKLRLIYFILIASYLLTFRGMFPKQLKCRRDPVGHFWCVFRDLSLGLPRQLFHGKSRVQHARVRYALYIVRLSFLLLGQDYERAAASVNSKICQN